jgi:hypothetical protein
MFRGKGGVDGNVLNLNNPFRKVIHFLVSFEKDAIPVGEVKNTRKGGRLAIHFDLPDDRVGHGVRR